MASHISQFFLSSSTPAQTESKDVQYPVLVDQNKELTASSHGPDGIKVELCNTLVKIEEAEIPRPHRPSVLVEIQMETETTPASHGIKIEPVDVKIEPHWGENNEMKNEPSKLSEEGSCNIFDTKFEIDEDGPMHTGLDTDMGIKQKKEVNKDMPSMRELCEKPVPDEDRDFFSRVVNILNQNYPQDWGSWKVENHSYTELFGERITSETEKKLRFAIPTADLAYAYSPKDPTLSEKKYRLVKRKLLEWPLGRALIYSPHAVMEKIHAQSYAPFMDTVKFLKPKLTSRKRCLSPQPSTSNNEMQISFFERMMSVLNVSAQTMADVANQVADLSAKVNNKLESPSEADSESDYEHFSPDVNESGSTVNPTEEANYQSDDCNFSPCTTEAEPKLAKANPRLAEQGRKCQRLGDQNWKNVRYADVQKHFHATPVFSALKVNSLLATNTPSWSSLGHLKKSDSTLGAITYGLLLQRAAFEEAFTKLDKKCRQEVQRNFLDEGCEFKKISDNLLQYACGRRAEVIQTRRETYKCPNKVLNDLLHEIPPSETHLFSEDKLLEVVKEQGGIYKFFPKKTTSSNKPTKKNPAKGPNYKLRNDNTNKHSKMSTNRNFRPSWKHEKSSNKNKPSTNEKKD